MSKHNLGKIIMLSLPLIFVILFIYFIMLSSKSKPSSTFLTPSPTPSSAFTSDQTRSIWAQDEKYIEFEQKIIETEKKLDVANLTEDELTPPVLDLNIQF